MKPIIIASSVAFLTATDVVTMRGGEGKGYNDC